MEEVNFDGEMLMDTVKMKMPFGKHKGKLICDIPNDYLIWYKNKGFPKGKLGLLMGTVCEMKCNGLDTMFDKLKKLLPKEEQVKKRNILLD